MLASNEPLATSQGHRKLITQSAMLAALARGAAERRIYL
jgi:hypothetical protein